MLHFQGRYQAILCDRDAYLLELVRYIHLNPARLKVPANPWRYPWSSIAAYLGKTGLVKVDTQEVLGQFGKHVSNARRAYQRFIGEGLKQGHDEKYYDTVDQRFLGEQSFVEAVSQRSEAKDVEVTGRRVSYARLLQAVCELHGVDSQALVQAGRQRQWVAVRAQLVYLAREWSGVTTKELGRRLHRDASMVSRLYGWYQEHREELTERRLVRKLAK